MQLNEKEIKARDLICLPLDRLYSLEEIKERIEQLKDYVGVLKVGMSSFTRFGPEAIKLIQQYSKKTFLDLKYKDIPATLKDACSAAAELGVDIVTVHADGGEEMLQAAMQGAKEGAERSGNQVPKIVAITVLTSIDQDTLHNQLNIQKELQEQALTMAKLAHTAGLDGIVCSGKELKYLKPHFSEEFLFITPGIKGPNTAAGLDQKRVMSPGNAIQDGSSLLVIGRAITAAENPQQAAHEILQDIAQHL